MVADNHEALAGGADPRLDDRVLELLAGHRGEFAFSGLRRTLGAHPESLTRALRRLQRRGEIEHSPSGYRIRPEGLLEATAERPLDRDVPAVRTVAEVRLFPPPEEPEVLGRLAGHWFGTLRWVGVYERPEGSQLVWSRADGPGRILLTYRRGQLGDPRAPRRGPRVGPPRPGSIATRDAELVDGFGPDSELTRGSGP
jgi:hypothetical protein